MLDLKQLLAYNGDMKTREQIITGMCYTYRHDFGLDRHPDDAPWLAGMTDVERRGLWRTMAQIFDNDIMPLLDEAGIKIERSNDGT